MTHNPVGLGTGPRPPETAGGWLGLLSEGQGSSLALIPRLEIFGLFRLNPGGCHWMLAARSEAYEVLHPAVA